MRLKLLLIFIVLIMSSLAGAAESIEDILDYQTEEVQCTRAGQSCTWNNDCCSGYCNSTGTCDAGGGSCVRAGNSCNWNSECCSGYCNSTGTCDAGGGSCVRRGYSCDWSSECCSNFCGTSGTCN